MARIKTHRSRGYVDSFIPTGSRIGFCGSTAPDGWALLIGLTIGNAASGASERANADCEDLFTLLWDEYTDTECPVVGGRGGSAAADWAANKELTLIDYRGRNVVGQDVDNGAGFKGLLSVAGCGIDGKTLGTVVGTETHTLSAVQSGTAVHGHDLTGAVTAQGATATGSNSVTPVITWKETTGTGGATLGIDTSPNITPTIKTSATSEISQAAHSHTTNIAHGHADTFAVSNSAAAAAANAHQNVQPTIIENCIIKL